MAKLRRKLSFQVDARETGHRQTGRPQPGPRQILSSRRAHRLHRVVTEAESLGGATGYLHGDVVTGENGIEGLLAGLADNPGHRLRRIRQLDVHTVGDLGNDGVTAFGGDHQAHAERCRRRLIGGDAIAVMESDQKHARVTPARGARLSVRAGPGQPQPPPGGTAAPQAPHSPLPPVV